MGDQPTALAASGGNHGHPTDRSGRHLRPTYCSGCQWRQPGHSTRSLAVTRGSNGRPAHRFGCQWRQQWATSPPLWLPVEAAMGTLPTDLAVTGGQLTALAASGGSQRTLLTALAVTGGQLTALAASGGSQGTLPDLSLSLEAAMGDQPTALAASGGSQGTLPTDLAITGGQLTALAASGGSQGTLPDLSLSLEAAMGDQPTALAASGGSIGRPAHRFGCQWRQQWATSPPLWLPVEAARAPYRPLWPSLEANLLLWPPVEAARAPYRPLWLPVEAAMGDQPTALAASGGSQGNLSTALAVT